MGRATQHRKAKRKKGLCAAPACREVTGDEYRCPDCKRAHADYERSRYWARKTKAA